MCRAQSPMTCECRLYALWRVLTRSRPFRCRVGYCNALKLDGTWCPWECSSRHKTEPETGHTARNLSWKAAWFWTSASFPPFFPPTRPLSRAQTLGMCLFLPCAVLLQFSHCCRFCFVACFCFGLIALLHARVWGFLCAFFPPPVFLPLFCLRVLCAPLPVFLPLLLFFSFFFPVVSPPPACVWVDPRTNFIDVDRSPDMVRAGSLDSSQSAIAGTLMMFDDFRDKNASTAHFSTNSSRMHFEQLQSAMIVECLSQVDLEPVSGEVIKKVPVLPFVFFFCVCVWTPLGVMRGKKIQFV